MKLFELIGNTPLVELSHIPTNPKVKFLCKMEGQNPGGSVKDRAAFNMLQSALDRGEIKRGDKLVEATSGNTGIALAMVAKVLGLDMTLIMPDNSTRERVLSMEAYGARVILTPAAKTIEYSRTLAEEMNEKEGYFMLNQFANPDNYLAHYKTTGPEIWNDTQGKVTHFVSAMGTTGTIMGVSRYLKEKNPSIQIVGTQPTDGSSIPGIRRWSPEFLPAIFEKERVDRVIDVSQDQATEMTRRMAKEEGILAGMSSGGALHAAIELSKELEEGVIVCITCDRGDRYLSSDLFG
ncbi:MAG TPA: cysteine synthase B [Algoriphagus sp.]|jgi:cysteine synthase B|uniref:cysteine synthase CysM n=1 Tax=unclassified Algoriphagus TaxID=2641541 RepID=UPI000C5D8196|nr:MULTISPECIES: cysteine synthase CysM [unclassified Algoriphagus]MAL14990.1 cysteine synthase B [Algoriphagus sp.]QYH39848.1 cysteine synthase CysM [Algoriphagus sp. NBT04N3]HAH37031.1 cysteine synthase B [Algoriphagus sp.]HAS60546.1 cysteine synthase B [Algoriphagus sp.]HCD86081.1 cysteine synthase B [Algoriphagus sp.]|tara:strand:- start:68 stop:946 length:879 start_codon:yes stop_codon:yes gene_type:complete